MIGSVIVHHTIFEFRGVGCKGVTYARYICNWVIFEPLKDHPGYIEFIRPKGWRERINDR
jgi:hypothetical protein